MTAGGYGEGSRDRILDHLKRNGRSSVPDLATAFGVSVETVRSQIKTLVDDGLVSAVGSRRRGRGRPERLFGLAPSAESRFPRREGEVLRGLAAYLSEVGQQNLLRRYLDRFAEERRDRALSRLDGLEGAARLAEVARILTEEGYMAEIVEGRGVPRLRLCHCPLRALVDVSEAPCRAEVRLVRALVGGSLARVEYLPDGDPACTYELSPAGGERGT